MPDTMADAQSDVPIDSETDSLPDVAPPFCPDDMALVANAFCMDRFEASRSDATATDEGSQTSQANSQPGVLPWMVYADNAAAEAACEAAGKGLCTAAQWEAACEGSDQTKYAYGNTYQPLTCNGIDAFGPNAFRLAPTGSFPECVDEWGVFDLNGNVWEHIAGGTGMTVRGGAYNCVDSVALHQCSYVPRNWTPNALGFRCCVAVQTRATDESTSGALMLPTSEEPQQSRPHKWARRSPLPSRAHRRGRLGSCSTPVATKTDTQSAILVDARRYLDENEGQAALELLKKHRASLAGEREFELLLASSYLVVGNDFWALRTLAAWLSQHPDDCEASLLMAWIYLEKASLEEAERALSHANCADQEPALAARSQLLAAQVYTHQGETESARASLEAAATTHAIFRSDAPTRASLVEGVLPSVVRWRASVAAGYTSNALSSSPEDLSSSGLDPSSPLLQTDLWVALAPFPSWPMRPLLEGQFRALELTSSEVSNLSNLEFSGRVGAEWSSPAISGVVAYHGGALRLDKGDIYDAGPVWYYGTHRGEVEVQLGSWALLFAGVGRRTFREQVRSRTEVDGGVGGDLHIAGPVSLLWALNMRTWLSEGDAYDLFGGSLMAHVQVALPLAVQLRFGGSYGVDSYADSAGYFGADARAEDLTRATLVAWSPPWYGFRAGLTLAYVHRTSSIERFEFDETRTTLSLRWTGTSAVDDPQVLDDPVTRLPWPDPDAIEKNDSERIQDLLRQDEDVQRSSSCVQ